MVCVRGGTELSLDGGLHLPVRPTCNGIPKGMNTNYGNRVHATQKSVALLRKLLKMKVGDGVDQQLGWGSACRCG